MNRDILRSQILEVLQSASRPLSAREILVILHSHGYREVTKTDVNSVLYGEIKREGFATQDSFFRWQLVPRAQIGLLAEPVADVRKVRKQPSRNPMAESIAVDYVDQFRPILIALATSARSLTATEVARRLGCNSSAVDVLRELQKLSIHRLVQRRGTTWRVSQRGLESLGLVCQANSQVPNPPVDGGSKLYRTPSPTYQFLSDSLGEDPSPSSSLPLMEVIEKWAALLELQRQSRDDSIECSGGKAPVPVLFTTNGLEVRACVVNSKFHAQWLLLDDFGNSTREYLPYRPARVSKLTRQGYCERELIRPARAMILSVESGPFFLHVEDVLDHRRCWQW